MAKKNLDSCRSGEDFVALASKHGACVKMGKGDHCKVFNAKGEMVVIPLHKELATGTRCAIAKGLIAIGLAVLAVCFLL